MVRHRRLDVEHLAAAQQAAKVAGAGAGHWWKALSDAANSTTSKESLDAVFGEAIDETKRALEADAVALLIADPKDDDLVLRAWTGLSDDGPTPTHDGNGIAGWVIANGRPLIVADVSKIDAAMPAMRDSGLRSVAAVPLVCDDRLLGVLYAAASERDRFTGTDVAMLELVAERLAAAVERVRLFEAEHLARVQAERMAEVSAFFARAARVLAEGSDLADTLDRLASVALPALGDICLIDVSADDGQITRMVARHRDAARQELVERLRTRYAPDPASQHPAARVIATGETRWSREMGDEFLKATTQDEEHLEFIRSLGLRSYISVPLRHEDDTLGCVTLVSVTRRFEPDDVAFAEQLAEQVAAVVHNARRYDLANQTSQILQSTLLPKRLPKIEGLAMHTRYVAASEGIEVGGDFFDVVALPDDRVAFMIGDVSGHDRDAAALMGQLRSAARTLVGRVASPAAMISALQDSWARLDFDRMATAVFGQIDLATGELALASAGHYPPLIVEPGSARVCAADPECPARHRSRGAPGVARPPPGRSGPPALHRRRGRRTGEGQRAEHGGAGARAAVSASGVPMNLAAICDGVVAALPEERDDVALLALMLEG